MDMFKFKFTLFTWFTKDWWVYLFKTQKRDKCYVNKFKRAICRYKQHPAGVVWYNLYGLEPDMTCRYCGDDLS